MCCDDDQFWQQVNDDERRRFEEESDARQAEMKKLLGEDPAYIQWVQSTEGNEYDEISKQGED